LCLREVVPHEDFRNHDKEQHMCTQVVVVHYGIQQLAVYEQAQVVDALAIELVI
jgi:hypothetical protein